MPNVSENCRKKVSGTSDKELQTIRAKKFISYFKILVAWKASTIRVYKYADGELLIDWTTCYWSNPIVHLRWDLLTFVCARQFTQDLVFRWQTTFFLQNLQWTSSSSRTGWSCEVSKLAKPGAPVGTSDDGWSVGQSSFQKWSKSSWISSCQGNRKWG